MFVKRFDDFFDYGVHSAIAFGLVLTWMWIGLTEGYPIFMDGDIDLPSVIVLLAFFCGALFSFGYIRLLDRFLQNSVIWVVLASLVSAACLFLLLVYYELVPMGEFGSVVTTRFLMAVLGFGASVLVLCCAAGYAQLRPASSGVGFCFSVLVVFAIFFALVVCGEYIKGFLFCSLPLLSSLVLFKGRKSIVGRLQLRPNEDLPFAKGFLSMCLSFGVFFFAIATKCSFEPVSEFAEDANTSVVGIFVVSILFLCMTAFRQNPIGVFRALKLTYSAAVMILTICIALAPLSIEPYVGIVYNADVMAMIMVLWLLTAFVSHSNEAYVTKVVGLAIGSAALGMLLGWLFGISVYRILGHDRSYPTIALACAVAVFSTVGFSSKRFPYLTRKGEGAKKAARKVPYESVDYCEEAVKRHGLSKRETEVLDLLVKGYGSEAISEKLVISYHTARTHVRNIYAKMDIHSQRELLDDYKRAKEQHESKDPAGS